LQSVAVIFDDQNPQTLTGTVCVFGSIFAHFRVPQGTRTPELPGRPISLRNERSVVRLLVVVWLSKIDSYG
jgi:hypothetical protein